jgi:hypothetical protein
MLQLLITILIVTIATGIAVYRIIKYFKDPLHACDGCEKVCGECPLEDLRSQVKTLKKSNDK